MPDAPPLSALAVMRGEVAAPISADQLRLARHEIQGFLLQYEFGLREIETKLSILSDEFQALHDYNPIEHVNSRVKSPESLLDKVARKGVTADLAAVRDSITDIAGVRVTCAFVADVYRLFDLLTRQDDVALREVKDYIADPKPNGYQSLHAIVEIPVFLSSGAVSVPVEVQFRTIAMDFWASLEHKIYYKYSAEVPAHLLAELREAASTAAELDARMERLHTQIRGDQRASARIEVPVSPR